MKIKIGKEFSWEMSHRLPFHTGLCTNIHGHSYKMLVEVEGDKDSNGMLLDYYIIGEIVSPLINELDHAFLCDANDTVMLDFLNKNDFKHLVIPVTTTSENIAEYILGRIKPYFEVYSNIDVLKIRFYETSDAFAEIEERLRADL